MKLPIWDWQILNQTNLPWRPLSIWNLPHTLSSWKLLMLWGPKSIDFNNFQFLWGVSHLKENMKRFLQCIISFFFMKIRKKWVLHRYSISISLHNARQPADRGDCLCCLLWRRLFLLDAACCKVWCRCAVSCLLQFALLAIYLLLCNQSTVFNAK